MPPTPESIGPTSVEQVLEAGRKIAVLAHQAIDIDGHKFMVHPSGNGYTLVNVTHLLPPDCKPAPKRKFGVVNVHDIDSFLAYYKTHAEEKAAVIFVDISPTGATFVGVMNGHGEKPGFGDHKVVYTLKQSVEWERWMKLNNQLIEQLAFCEHLSDCQEFIVSPRGTDLVALLSTLEGKNNAYFKSVHNLFNGQMKVAYEEDITIKGEGQRQSGELTTIPEEIVLAIPPFENCGRVKALARLKVRVRDGKLKFHYETGASIDGQFALNINLLIRLAIDELIVKITEATTVKPLLGKL